jgi:hypothetical protein
MFAKDKKRRQVRAELTHIATHVDLRCIFIRVPSSGTIVLRQRRVLPLASIGARVPTSSSLRRHSQPDSQHYIGTATNQLTELQHFSLPRPERDNPIQGVSLQWPQ